MIHKLCIPSKKKPRIGRGFAFSEGETGPLTQHLLDHGQELVRGEGFDDPARGPGGLAFGLFAGLGFRGQHDHRDEFVGGLGPDALDQANAVKIGHVEIGDHHVDRAGHLGKRVLAVRCFDDVVAFLFERHGDHLSDAGRIVHGHDAFGHLNPRRRRSLRVWACGQSPKRARRPEPPGKPVRGGEGFRRFVPG